MLVKGTIEVRRNFDNEAGDEDGYAYRVEVSGDVTEAGGDFVVGEIHCRTLLDEDEVTAAEAVLFDAYVAAKQAEQLERVIDAERDESGPLGNNPGKGGCVVVWTGVR